MLVLSLSSVAQPEYSDVERQSYRLYLDKSWDSLLCVGKQALRSGIDYFLLRSRLGAARFEKQQYIRAAYQFEQARTFNISDAWVNRLLYYSLLYSGRAGQARTLAMTMPDARRSEIGFRRKVLETFSLEFGYTLSNAFQKSDYGQLAGPGSVYGEQDLYGNNLYAHADFTLNVSGQVSLTLGYNYLNFKKRKIFHVAYPEAVLDSTGPTPWGYANYYSFPVTVRNPGFDYSLNQHEIHLSANWIPADGTRIIPSAHMVLVDYRSTDALHQVTERELIRMYNQSMDIYYTMAFIEEKYRFRQRDTSYVNFLVSLLVTRDFDLFTAGLSGSWSNLNGSEQAQAGLDLTWYPLGTLDFYGTTGLITFLENQDSRMIFRQMVGVKLWKWLWIEGDFLYGNLANGNLANGQVIYNNSDRIRYRAGGNLIFPLFRQMTVSLTYQFFERESTILRYSRSPGNPDAGITLQILPMKYQTNSLYLSLKYNL